MLIRKIVLENFQCYYGYKEFKLSKGLNIILGANSHGKSKLFDAIQWLFSGEVEEDGVEFIKENLISKKALSEIEVGGDLNLSVAMEIDKGDEPYSLTRKYSITKKSNDEISINETFEGEKLFSNGERQFFQGSHILEEVFPSSLRKYCLFKGERSLNVFDPNRNPDALNNLVNALSEFKSLDRYIDITQKLYLASKNSVERLASSSSNNQRKYNDSIGKRDTKSREVDNCKEDIKSINKNLDFVKQNMNDSIGLLEKGDAIKQMNKEIKKLDDDINSRVHAINTNTEYTKFLFDDKWILNQFKPIQDEYDSKIKSFSRARRKFDSEFYKEKGKKEGITETIAELTRTKIPLPIGTPSVEHMEEMLNEEICKVCNREAKVGSEEYNYMKGRLEKFIKSLEPEIENESEIEEVPFKNSFVEEFRDINKKLERSSSEIQNIKSNIIQNIEFVDGLRNDLIPLKDRLAEKEKEKDRLLSRYSTGERDLLQTASDIRKYSSDQTTYEQKLIRKTQELEKLEIELFDLESSISKINVEGVPSIYIEKKEICYDLSIVAKEIKEKKYNGFLEDLRIKANEYYLNLGKASSGYTGIIDIYKLNDDKVVVRAVDEITKNDVTNSISSSTKTSLHLSILMAISDLTKSKKSESFPVIFDAPVSDFDHAKSIEFFNISKNTFEQSIVMMKNYVMEKEDEKGVYFIEEEFKRIEADNAYWVKLDDGIDPTNLETVDSKLVPLI